MIAVPIMVYLGRSSKTRIKSNISIFLLLSLICYYYIYIYIWEKKRTQKEIKYVCNKYKRCIKILENKKKI
jgi:hypothetical protein